jgi:hypothetical protein
VGARVPESRNEAREPGIRMEGSQKRGVCGFPPGECEDGCFFSVEASNGAHVITAISGDRPSGCPGESTPEGRE